ncbi:MAG TPA: hypothetical protein VMS11_04695 [Solirubrobacterales bacterium]|nr:hypothetical protein [Solirubrobacterales bacterium]
MPRVITLSDFRPSERVDEKAWIGARIEETDDPSGSWEEVESVTLDPVDEDPAEPTLRSFTAAASKAWIRIVFLDEDGGEDAPSPMVFVAGSPFRPTLAQVSAILRARTYSGAEPDPDNPMDVLAGGVVLGEFVGDKAETIEDDLIPKACIDVERAVGRQVPGIYLDDARHIAAVRTASEIERSYIPEQASETKTIYQTLRMTFEEEATALRRRLQWWVLAEDQERE